MLGKGQFSTNMLSEGRTQSCKRKTKTKLVAPALIKWLVSFSGEK